MGSKDASLDFPVLETRRLVLRQLNLGDASDILELSSDPDVALWQWGRPLGSLEEAEQVIADALASYQRRQTTIWAIVERNLDKVISIGGFVEQIPQHRRAQLGGILSKQFWNQGIAKEAAEQILDWCFVQADYNRIEASCWTGNVAAIKVLEKLGMKREGKLRQYVMIDGNYRDHLLYSIIRTDYLSLAHNSDRN